MNLEITSLYAVPMAVLMFLLWLNVVKRRSAAKISIGYGDDTTLHEKIRRHGNFIEFVPMVLVMMALAEMNGANGIALHSAGILLVVSRAAHPFGLHQNNALHVLRIIGNSGSMLALFIAAGAIVATHI